MPRAERAPIEATDSVDAFGLSSSQRAELFDQLVESIERLDAEGLEVRSNTRRPLTWQETTAFLREEFLAASSPWEYKQVFERLNFAYPNQHAQVEYGPGFPPEVLENPRFPAVAFQSFWPGEKQVVDQVVFVDPRLKSIDGVLPELGDEVVAINGRSIEAWREENFNYCKHALRIQCDALFSLQFQWERLSWNSSMPLHMSIKSGERLVEFDIPLMEPQPEKRAPKDPPERYPGFAEVYNGENAQIFRSNKDPHTIVLRIKSFGYRPGALFERPIDEVAALIPSWEGEQYDHVVIDVSENRGGDDPLPYLRLFSDQPRIRQYTHIQFRKIGELFDPTFQRSLFWGDENRINYYRDLRSSSRWASIPDGGLLPPEPDFCGEAGCIRGMEPIERVFRGRISVIVSGVCFSSCDEFLLTLKSVLGDRVRLVGHPPFSDTGFSRLKIDVRRRPVDGRWVFVTPLDANPTDDTLIQQGVVVTRSVDEHGELTDGRPLPVDIHVPYTLQNRRTWIQSAVALALAD